LVIVVAPSLRYSLCKKDEANMKSYPSGYGRVFIIAVGLVLLSGAVLADDPASANREGLKICLHNMAARAQRYYHTNIYDGGGAGSFATVTLSDLISRPLNAYGTFSFVSASATQIVLSGHGTETGYNGSTPVQATMTVYSDSVTIVVDN